MWRPCSPGSFPVSVLYEFDFSILPCPHFHKISLWPLGVMQRYRWSVSLSFKSSIEKLAAALDNVVFRRTDFSSRYILLLSLIIIIRLFSTLTGVPIAQLKSLLAMFAILATNAGMGFNLIEPIWVNPELPINEESVLFLCTQIKAAC